MASYQPDPISLDWETAAGRALGKALASPAHWLPFRVPTRPTYSERESGGFQLSRDERAFQRSLYRPMKFNQRWSLMREWLPPVGDTRVIRIRVVSKASAERAVVQGRIDGPMWRDGGPARSDPQQRDW